MSWVKTLGSVAKLVDGLMRRRQSDKHEKDQKKYEKAHKDGDIHLIASLWRDLLRKRPKKDSDK